MDAFGKGLRDGVAIGLGYLSVSFSFGIHASTGGLTVLQSTLISLTNLTSAGQLAGLKLMLSAAPLVEVLLVLFTINLRYALMSISLTQKLDGSMTVRHRLLTSFFITDEVFAVASNQCGLIGKRYLYGLASMPFLGWTLGTLLGAAAGTVLPASITGALGIMIYGMFIAIIVPPSKHLKPVRLVVILASLMSLMMWAVPGLNRISSGFQIILCATAAAGIGAKWFPVRDDA